MTQVEALDSAYRELDEPHARFFTYSRKRLGVWLGRLLPASGQGRRWVVFPGSP